MSVTRPVKLSTMNENLGMKVEAEFDLTVPESIEEALEFFGSEEKLLDSIQSDIQQRKLNAARPVLRDAETEMDWAAVATQVAEGYTPGRRGGFGAVEVSEDELSNVDSADALRALLAAKGIKITS